MYPPLIRKAIKLFENFPGIGEKTAEKFIFYLLNNKESLPKFEKVFKLLNKNITQCLFCLNYTEKNPCSICSNPERNQKTLCVVAYPQDLAALETVSEFRGKYHLLFGLLDPLNGITPDRLKIKELVERLKKEDFEEIILALSPNIEGETTLLYLKNLLKKEFPSKKITRLGRGLPQGALLNYADEITLSNALEERKEI